jgi:DNA-binding phage protein
VFAQNGHPSQNETSLSAQCKHVPGKAFVNKELVAQALGEAILSGDADVVKEILEGFVRAQNVSKVAHDHGFSRGVIVGDE